jgi:hypothetical protein
MIYTHPVLDQSCHLTCLVPYVTLCHISHAISHMPYLTCHISHAISHMPYLMPSPSWHIHNYQHDIYPMPCLPCQTIYHVTYYPTPHFTCHLSYHLHHGISIITNMPYLTYHISHVISYKCHVIFSHVISPMTYITLSISCSISFVIHLCCHMCLYYF